MTFKTTTTWDGFFHPDTRAPEDIKLPMPPYTSNTGFFHGLLPDTYKTSLKDLKKECIMYENSGTTKWVAGPGWSRTEYLVGEDGAVLDDITYNSASELWHVGSTHINYITKDQAKAAAVLNMGKQRARCSECNCEDPC
jgi:hypothetical protein